MQNFIVPALIGDTGMPFFDSKELKNNPNVISSKLNGNTVVFDLGEAVKQFEK